MMGSSLVKPLLVQILVYHYHALVRAKRALNASNETVELSKRASLLAAKRPIRCPKDRIPHGVCVEAENKAVDVRRSCLKQLREEEYFLKKFVPNMKSIVGDTEDIEVNILYVHFGTDNDFVPDAEARPPPVADDYDEAEDDEIMEREPCNNIITGK